MAFDPTKIGAEFQYNDGPITLPANASFQIVPYNPYRVAFVFSSLTLNVMLRPKLPATAALGFLVQANTQPVFFKLTDVGPMVQQAWNGFNVGGGNVYFFEVLWVPPGE